MHVIRKTSISLLLIFSIAVPALAQGGPPAGSDNVPPFTVGHDIGTAIHRFPHDQLDIYTAPAHIGRSKHPFAYLIPFAVAGGLIAYDRRLSANLPKGHGGVSATIANVGLDGTGVATGVFYLYGVLAHNDHARETGLLAGESLLDSIIPHTALSLVFGRRRPFQGTGDELGEGEFFARHSASASFPSGHAMYTFAMATTFADEYPSTPSKLFWYGLGTTVAISRVTGREHFASDVVVGGAIGWMIAKHVYHKHHRVVP